MLNFKSFGDSSQTLIILHGLFGSLDNWQSIAQQLAKDFRVIIVDQRNHGKSPHFDHHNYQLMASDLKEIMDGLGIEKAHLLGHSMGGKTVMQFAVDYPYMVDRLIVVDISPRYYPPHHQENLSALNSVDFNEVNSRKEVEAILATQVKDAMVLQFLLKGLTYETSNQLRWKFNLKTLDREIENIGEALHEHAYFSNSTLFIRGDRSNYITEKDEELIEHIFPQVEIITIKNAGHWLHAEQAQVFTETVLSFLK